MNKIISKAISGQLDSNKDSIDDLMYDMLSAIRRHLRMELAFISEFEGDRRFFRHISSELPDPLIKINDSDPLDDSYCQRVVDGRLPELIHDATKNPVAKQLPVTDALPVGAHLSVPIELSNGDIYGTFCAFSREADLTLQDRDLELMRTFSEIAAKRIEKELELKSLRKTIENRINAVLEGDSLSIVYQPIFRLHDHKVMGFESLARFNIEPRRGPDVWFDEAASVDLSIPLELKAIEIALQGLVSTTVEN